MLDSLGLGEIFVISLMALIFFGPENLPRMAARLGKWIRSLTTTSRAFLTEWQEEALAVQEAVEQVRQIRDELYAARADIAGTINAARTDVDQALSAARADVNGQIASVTAPLMTAVGAPPARLPARAGSSALPAVETAAPTAVALREPQPAPANDGGAIHRTQAILDQLARKRAAAALPLENLSPGASLRGRGEEDLTPGPAPERRGKEDLERLQAQVAEMTAQVAALRAELDTLRVQEPAIAVAE